MDDSMERLSSLKNRAEMMASLAARDLDEVIGEVKDLLREIDVKGLLRPGDFELPHHEFLEKAEEAFLEYGIEMGEF
jgi:hypothetical protein